MWRNRWAEAELWNEFRAPRAFQLYHPVRKNSLRKYFIGHYAKNCPSQVIVNTQVYNAQMHAHHRVTCQQCGSEGHAAHECHQPTICRSCGQPGHATQQCLVVHVVTNVHINPSTVLAESVSTHVKSVVRKRCFTCGSGDHLARHCNIKKANTDYHEAL